MTRRRAILLSSASMLLVAAPVAEITLTVADDPRRPVRRTLNARRGDRMKVAGAVRGGGTITMHVTEVVNDHVVVLGPKSAVDPRNRP